MSMMLRIRASVWNFFFTAQTCQVAGLDFPEILVKIGNGNNEAISVVP
jgi:hypothetical protein